MLTIQVIMFLHQLCHLFGIIKQFHFGCVTSGLLPCAGNNHDQYLNHQISNFLSFFKYFSAVCP